MTDLQLISEAWNTSRCDWKSIDNLIAQTSNEATINQLRTIHRHKYHMEEMI